MAAKYLIVEGMYDKIFFEKIFEKIKLKEIQIRRPTDFNNAQYNGKGNCIRLLDDLVPLFNDGSISKLGLILDADFRHISSQGFDNTLKMVSEKLNKFGYDKKTKSNEYHKGLIFSASNGLPNIAIWIMPNNNKEGYIEYFLKDIISDKFVEMKEEAENICQKMISKKFSEHHLLKSEIAVFMAMQDNPGRNISHMIENSLIDFNKPEFKVFTTFLKQYFK